MKEKIYILFCESPFESGKVDEDFEDQFLAAGASGFETLLFSFEELTGSGSFSAAAKRIKPAEKLSQVIYRGWMLTPKQYSVLYNGLLLKNFRLINTPAEYQNCHYLPDSLKFIEPWTPRTVFQKIDNEDSISLLIDKTQVFGAKPVILKDYVKSEKHYWETACFVQDASDTGKLKQAINKLIELRGTHLNEGIAIREYAALNSLATHSKSGMPLTEEYRLFFCNKKLIGVYDYWEEGLYDFAEPGTTEFEEIAKQVESNFFSMDIGKQQNGSLIIIELGDGQVAGLPDKTDRNEFYQQLYQSCLKNPNNSYTHE